MTHQKITIKLLSSKTQIMPLKQVQRLGHNYLWPKSPKNRPTLMKYTSLYPPHDPSKHTIVTSLSSVLKAKHAARKKDTKKTQAFSPQLEALFERIENDDDFVGHRQISKRLCALKCPYKSTVLFVVGVRKYFGLHCGVSSPYFDVIQSRYR